MESALNYVVVWENVLNGTEDYLRPFTQYVFLHYKLLNKIEQKVYRQINYHTLLK